MTDKEFSLPWPMDFTSNLYARLGLPKDCTYDQIFDLDKNWDTICPHFDKLPEETRSLLSEALRILVDPQERRKYDEFGHSKFLNADKVIQGLNGTNSLWLGDIFAAYNTEFLKNENITSVL